MRERLLQSKDVAYNPGDYTGKNLSWMWPIGDLVNVMVDVVDEKMGKLGLVSMTADKAATMNSAATSGIIVAVGPDAFMWSADRMRPFNEAQKPKIGDRIVFIRYSGEEKVGVDGKMYRLMSDNSIVGIVKENENG